jgi:hypothetical protein
MRYTKNETTTLGGAFSTGDTVTITIINMDTDAELSLTTSNCSESAHIDGLFLFDTSNISTSITAYTNCAYAMNNGTDDFFGKFVIDSVEDDSKLHTSLDNYTSKADWKGLSVFQQAQLTRIHSLLDVIENGKDHAQVMRILLSAMSGKVSGAETETITFRDNADTKDRIVATTDANGNRSAVVLDDS